MTTARKRPSPTHDTTDVYDVDTAATTVKVGEATVLVCTECGTGHYATDGWGLWACTTTDCDHVIGWHDVLPEPGEYVTDVCGLLAVATS